MAEISDELAQRGTPISPPTEKKLLNENGFSKRQIVKSIAGGSGPQRNQQFELLADLQISDQVQSNLAQVELHRDSTIQNTRTLLINQIRLRQRQKESIQLIKNILSTVFSP